MQKIADFVNSSIDNYCIDSATIQNVETRVGEEMKVNGWILLILSNKECVTLKYNNGVYTNEGYVLSDEKVLKVLGNKEYENLDLVKDGIIELNHGSRYVGAVFKEIPFGKGELYDNNGLLVYRGIMINWKRFGSGVSYFTNGSKEYEGYWCDDYRFGIGVEYDNTGKIVKECNWYDGGSYSKEYEGYGRNLNIGLKRLKICDNCILKDWDVSLFYMLETIEIGYECFPEVKTFKIDGMNLLKSLKVGINSFTKKKNGSACDKSKSFHILNCECLETIDIGRFSFSDFGGEFELKNLPSLTSIVIGQVGRKSLNFDYSSFVIRGI